MHPIDLITHGVSKLSRHYKFSVGAVLSHYLKWYTRDHSGYGLNQWEATLQYNVVSHWLRPYTEWSIYTDDTVWQVKVRTCVVASDCAWLNAPCQNLSFIDYANEFGRRFALTMCPTCLLGIAPSSVDLLWIIMTSYSGNAFRITGPLWGESLHRSTVDSLHTGPLIRSLVFPLLLAFTSRWRKQ